VRKRGSREHFFFWLALATTMIMSDEEDGESQQARKHGSAVVRVPRDLGWFRTESDNRHKKKGNLTVKENEHRRRPMGYESLVSIVPVVTPEKPLFMLLNETYDERSCSSEALTVVVSNVSLERRQEVKRPAADT
jgi:hypothetical protein